MSLQLRKSVKTPNYSKISGNQTEKREKKRMERGWD